MYSIKYVQSNINLIEAEEILRCLEIIIDNFSLFLINNNLSIFKSLLEYQEKLSLIILNKKHDSNLYKFENKIIDLQYNIHRMKKIVIINSLNQNILKTEIANKEKEKKEEETKVFSIKNATVFKTNIAKFLDKKIDYYSEFNIPNSVTQYFVVD